jgi:AcrR family transcriptional regulator
VTTSSRDRYHHGDLANALTDAATAMARRGGPEAVVLRGAAREVGVSAAAAYRHFDAHSDLMNAVKMRAQAELAARMQTEVDSGEALPDAGAEALRRLRGLGYGYLRFALEQPGLFRTAFCRVDRPDESFDVGMMASPAFAMLASVLDELVTCGLMAPDQRPFSEIVAWSTMHGLATLILDGPLSQLSGPKREMVIDATMDRIHAGLTASGRHTSNSAPR